MSYLSQSLLEQDIAFQARTRSAVTQQSLIFRDDGRPDISATAEDLLRDAGGPTLAFRRLVAAAPGFAATVDTGDGTVDSSRISDEDILAAVQADFPTVASLFYDVDGNPIGGTA